MCFPEGDGDLIREEFQQRYLLGDLGVDGRTILEWTLKRWVSMRGIGLIRLRIGIIGEPL